MNEDRRDFLKKMGIVAGGIALGGGFWSQAVSAAWNARKTEEVQVRAELPPGAIRMEFWVCGLDAFEVTGYHCGQILEVPVTPHHELLMSESGFLRCEGQAFSPARYPKLYELLGEAYGLGQVPDLRARMGTRIAGSAPTPT